MQLHVCVAIARTRTHNTKRSAYPILEIRDHVKDVHNERDAAGVERLLSALLDLPRDVRHAL